MSNRQDLWSVPSGELLLWWIAPVFFFAYIYHLDVFCHLSSCHETYKNSKNRVDTTHCAIRAPAVTLHSVLLYICFVDRAASITVTDWFSLVRAAMDTKRCSSNYREKSLFLKSN